VELSQRAINRAVLARQGLLDRHPTSIPKTLERICGIQAQYAPSMYTGLWSRMDGFERDALTRALERRTVIQGTLMRVTIHLVPRNDYWPFAIATRDARRTWFLRTRPHLTETTMRTAADQLDKRLAQDGTLERKEIDALIGKERREGVGLWLDMVRVPPSGTWERRSADLFARATDWIGEPDIDEDAAKAHLVTRYLKAFGPASPKDIAAFAGLPGVDLEALDLRRFGDLVDVKRAPLPDPETPAPVRFLPTWDQTLIGHCRARTGILTDEHRSKVFANAYPQSFPTFLVDGSVAGTWKFEDDRVKTEPFGRLDAATRRALKEEGDRLAELYRS
jgi:hypothetical protein